MGYLDGVKYAYAESLLINSKISELDFKKLANSKMNNDSVNCEKVIVCDDSKIALLNCSVSGVGKYYYTGNISTEEPSNIDGFSACNVVVGEEKDDVQ